MLPSTQNRIAINLNFGELKHILSWCEKNCTGQFQYMEDPNGDGFYNSWIFFFENERDYVAFMLWKK